MKNFLLSALLITTLLPATAQTSGQEKKRQSNTPTLWNFTMPEEYVNVRDNTYLDGKCKLLIELNNPEQYKELHHVDTVIAKFLKDIAFYRDSFQSDGGNVRIDYAIDESQAFAKIRFKKYPPDGAIFMNRGNDLARLKLEQDTVRILVKHDPMLPEWDHSLKRHDFIFSKTRIYQLTFLVNNYTDLARFVTDPEPLRHMFDTLLATRRKGELINPYKSPSSTYFNTNSPGYKNPDLAMKPRSNPRFFKYGGLWDPADPNKTERFNDYLSIDGNIGVGLVRNMLAPVAELGITLIQNGRSLQNEAYLKRSFRAYVSSYFIYDRTAPNTFTPADNLFVNADFSTDRTVSVGMGYLISGKSNYFTGQTGKLFMNIKLMKKGLTVSPELIFTNDFKQIIPSVSVKVF